MKEKIVFAMQHGLRLAHDELDAVERIRRGIERITHSYHIYGVIFQEDGERYAQVRVFIGHWGLAGFDVEVQINIHEEENAA